MSKLPPTKQLSPSFLNPSDDEHAKDMEWVRLYFIEFQPAIAGRGALFIGAYWSAILFYLNDRCRGIDNDPEILKHACELTDDGWDLVGNKIFQQKPVGSREFFRLKEDGRWHQKRALGEFQRSLDAYSRQVAGGKNRWK